MKKRGRLDTFMVYLRYTERRLLALPFTLNNGDPHRKFLSSIRKCTKQGEYPLCDFVVDYINKLRADDWTLRKILADNSHLQIVDCNEDGQRETVLDELLDSMLRKRSMKSLISVMVCSGELVRNAFAKKRFKNADDTIKWTLQHMHCNEVREIVRDSPGWKWYAICNQISNATHLKNQPTVLPIKPSGPNHSPKSGFEKRPKEHPSQRSHVSQHQCTQTAECLTNTSSLTCGVCCYASATSRSIQPEVPSCLPSMITISYNSLTAALPNKTELEESTGNYNLATFTVASAAIGAAAFIEYIIE